MIQNLINLFNQHKEDIAVVVLTFHTISKAVSDSLKARESEPKSFGKFLSVTVDTLKYLFGGQRA